jgi:hypothetical protein
MVKAALDRKFLLACFGRLTASARWTAGTLMRSSGIALCAQAAEMHELAANVKGRRAMMAANRQRRCRRLEFVAAFTWPPVCLWAELAMSQKWSVKNIAQSIRVFRLIPKAANLEIPSDGEASRIPNGVIDDVPSPAELAPAPEISEPYPEGEFKPLAEIRLRELSAPFLSG